MIDLELSGPLPFARLPFGAPPSLPAHCLVEEYFVRGEARSYLPRGGQAPDGRWEAQADAAAEFATRALVVRPLADFNGVVFVGWANVTPGYEVQMPGVEGMVGSSAWVSISAQAKGVESAGPSPPRRGDRAPLMDADPERYSSLRHPGDPFSYDIFWRTARYLRRHARALFGAECRSLIAVGVSQSAARLMTYMNALHPSAPTFDGFLLGTSFGVYSPFDESDPFAVRMGRPYASVRTDLGAPTLIVESETEIGDLRQAGQADTADVRVWEVAGAPHLNARAKAPEGFADNKLSWHPVFAVAAQRLADWTTTGREPPAHEPLVFDPAATEIVRDGFGNALGGLRLPELDAPRMAYYGIGRDWGAASLYGYARPFTAQELGLLYPSDAAWEASYRAALEKCVRGQTLLASHAAQRLAALPSAGL